VDRLIVRPWERQREVVDSLHRFAETMFTAAAGA
jgi:hypothetical protein